MPASLAQHAVADRGCRQAPHCRARVEGRLVVLEGEDLIDRRARSQDVCELVGTFNERQTRRTDDDEGRGASPAPRPSGSRRREYVAHVVCSATAQSDDCALRPPQPAP